MASSKETTSGNPLLPISGIIRILRTLAPDMPMQQADILIAVAMNPGATMNDLSRATGLSQSSISRNVQAMSRIHRLGKPGLDLMEAEIDPREPRRRVIFLTSKGKTFITRLVRQLDPTFSIDKDTDARVEMERMEETAMAERAAKNGK